MNNKIKFNLDDINYLIKESIKKINEGLTTYYVVDDGGVFNVFSSDMFDQNGRYIENPSLNFDDFDVVKKTYNAQAAWDYADKMNRESEENSDHFSPSKGYYDESKKSSLSLTESKLQNIIKQCINEVFGLDEEFDNLTSSDLEKFNGNYYSVIVPEWALNALVNGDYEGLNEQEIADVEAFEKHFAPGGPCELLGGMNVGDFCIPMEGASPSFEPKNDINHEGADCYKFALIAKQD